MEQFFKIFVIVVLLYKLNYYFKKRYRAKGYIYSDGSYYGRWIQKLRKLYPNYGIYESKKFQECDFILPTEYSKNQNRLKTLFSNDNRNLSNRIVIFGIPNNLEFGYKEKLWNNVKSLKNVMPECFELPREFSKLRNLKTHVNIIYKSNKQRQKGLYLTNRILNSKFIKKNKFVVAQKFFNNPYLYNGHKINLRTYLMVVCFKKNRVNHVVGYLYDDGIVSYAKKKFDLSLNREKQIASFYNSKRLYDQKYPITLKEIFKEHPRLHHTTFPIIINKTKRVFGNVKRKIIKNGNSEFDFGNFACIEIFGLDWMIDNNLNAWLLEANLCPGMEAYNSKDEIMRLGLLNEIIKTSFKFRNKNFNGNLKNKKWINLNRVF